MCFHFNIVCIVTYASCGNFMRCFEGFCKTFSKHNSYKMRVLIDDVIVNAALLYFESVSLFFADKLGRDMCLVTLESAERLTWAPGLFSTSGGLLDCT